MRGGPLVGALRLQLAGEPTWAGLIGRPTLGDRAESYRARFPECPNSVWVAGDKGQWLYGCWQLGADYKNKTPYYGAFPPSLLERIYALFPEIPRKQVLQAFSGSLPPSEYTRLDINPDLRPELVGNIYDVAKLTRRRFRLAIADPPYTAKDAKQYGTAGVDRGRAMRALADVVKPGGHVAWLDQTWPMHRKKQWRYYGAIQVIRSTNHRFRGVSLFERKAIS